MDGLQTEPAPVSNGQPAVAVESYADFYNSSGDAFAAGSADAPGSGDPGITPTESAPAAPAAPAPAAPATETQGTTPTESAPAGASAPPAGGSAAPAVGDSFDDLFDEPAPATPAAAGAPAVPPAPAGASAAPTGTAPPAPVAPPLPDPSVSVPPVSDRWTAVTQRFGLPAEATEADLDAVISNRVAQIVQHGQDPIAAAISGIDKMLAVTDNQEFIRQVLTRQAETEQGFVDEDEINDRIDRNLGNGKIDQWASTLRARLDNDKAVQQQQQQQQDRAAAARAATQSQIDRDYQNSVREAGKNFEGFGKKLSSKVQTELIENYALNGRMLKDLNSKILTDPELVIKIAGLLHPEYGPRFEAYQREQLMQKGASQVYKQMDGADIKTGQPGELPDTSAVLVPNYADFYGTK